MKALILTAAVAVTTLALGGQEAKADWYGGYNYGGYGYPVATYSGHVHHGANPWVNPGLGHYDWHNTTHLDYQPATVVPHYNHFHYQPGGYILHQTGHYDLHH
jgi:hypothetical protein